MASDERDDSSASRIADDVYRRLRSDIVLGRLRPNERLVEAEIAERLNASRTPIREGLQRLAYDGLVHSRRRGWTVHEHTLPEIREIYETRLALEGFAARLAAERATAEQAADLLDRFGDHDLDDPDGASDAVAAKNTEFHDGVVAISGNGRLLDLIQRSRNYAFNQRLGRLYTREELRESSEGHRRLIAAIAAHNPDEAERLARGHVERALAIIEERLP